jgi:hypothetical protein
MKSAAIAVAFLALGLCIGSFLHPASVHAQAGLRDAHIMQVNMSLSTGRSYTFNGVPLGLSCIPARGNPDCYVLVEGK